MCSLTIFGRSLDAEKCAAAFPHVSFSTIVCHGQTLEGRATPADFGLLVIEISSKECADIHQQAADALAYLEKHELLIKQLREYPEVQEVYLDFGVQGTSRPVFCRFSPELIAAATKCKIAIEMTILPGPSVFEEYLESEPEANSESDPEAEIVSPFLFVD